MCLASLIEKSRNLLAKEKLITRSGLLKAVDDNSDDVLSVN